MSLSIPLAQILKYTKTNVLIDMMIDHAKSNGQVIDCDCVKANYSKFLDFVVQNLFQFNSDSDLDVILDHFGLKSLVTDDFRVALWCVCLKNFVKYNKLSEAFLSDPNFPKEKLVEAGQNIETGVSSNVSAGVSLAGVSTTSGFVKNLQVEPTFTKLYITGNVDIDNYIRYSLVFYFNYKNWSRMTKMQKLCCVQLNQYLCKNSAYIISLYRQMNSTRYCRSGQFLLSAYLESFSDYHLGVFKDLSKYKVVPFLVELSGLPGVGKSTLVDLLAEFLHEMFPFYSEHDMKYNRVNDKFWNGYKQQPIVLYDDQNQNRNLLYNLDNELIGLGSGQFVYPPMAFEKNIKFSSLFVVFTTNKRLVVTTRADKGAVSRRIHTYVCEPNSELGAYVQSEYGRYWRYDEDVLLNPFNLGLKGGETSGNVINVVFSFVKFQVKQTFLQDRSLSNFWYVGQKKLREKQFSLVDHLKGVVPERSMVVPNFDVKQSLSCVKVSSTVEKVKAEMLLQDLEVVEPFQVTFKTLKEVKPKSSFLSFGSSYSSFGEGYDVENQIVSFLNKNSSEDWVKLDKWGVSVRMCKEYRFCVVKSGRFIYLYTISFFEGKVENMIVFDLVTGKAYYSYIQLAVRSMIKRDLESVLSTVSVVRTIRSAVPFERLSEVVYDGF